MAEDASILDELVAEQVRIDWPLERLIAEQVRWALGLTWDEGLRVAPGVLGIPAIARALAIAAAVDAEPMRPETHVGEDFDGETRNGCPLLAMLARMIGAR